MLRQNVVVTVSNITSNAVVISPKSVIGELQSVTSLLRKVQSLKLMCCRKFILTLIVPFCSGKDCLICCVNPRNLFQLVIQILEIVQG